MRLPQHRRAGFTLLEAIIALVVTVVVVIVAIPLIYKGTQSLKRNGCSFNLRNLGQALDSYQTAHHGTLPCGARYQMSPESPWGPSWWVEMLPYTESVGKEFRWNHQVASSGDFAGVVPNPNLAAIDGLLPRVMRCPASPLPEFGSSSNTISESNAKALGHAPRGIAMPSYVAISGSAPDMMGVSPTQSVAAVHGRTTREGQYGILSASGAFPPNQPLKHAGLRDGVGHVIVIGEQSTWGYDDYFDPPLTFDLQSCWPGGAYKGAGGNYGNINPNAEGINGSGDERCFNITTIRYPINTILVDTEKPKAGIIAHPTGPIPEPPEGKQPKKAPPQPPGPGHNQGIFSAHPGGAHVLYGDGHVEFKTNEMDLPTLQMLVTRDDGNIVNE
jgi:prepilin-type processing-associated H-X9-DG protein